MELELTEGAIVDSFKKDLANIKFIEVNLHEDIAQKLDILASSARRRNEKIEVAKDIWKLFFRKCLSNITTNMRGCEQICSYYDEFCKYENLLFAIDENHRDHVLHSVWVMLLGLYLRKYFKQFSPESSYINFVPRSRKPSNKFATYQREVLDFFKQYEIPLWCLIALTHDLGYPVEKTRIANREMTRMIRHFGFLENTDFEYKFNIIHETAIETLLTILTTGFISYEGGKNYLIPMPGDRLEFAKSFERLEHGIMSAYLLMATLDWICEALSWDAYFLYGVLEAQDIAKRLILSEWLYAIAAHTARFHYWDDLGNTGFLLFLCDQLDEFSRFSLDRKNRDWTKVTCRTEFNITDKLINIKHVLDDKNIMDDIETFFKKRATAFRERIELGGENQLNDLSVICTDVREAVPIKYTYEKYRDATPGELVKREPGSSTNDILGFLNGTVDLARISEK
jgi:hypothetical protein